MPSFNQETFLIVLQAAITLALLGSIDSLLTSLVADNMTRTRHNSNRELIGQGIGNMVAGLFGGIVRRCHHENDDQHPNWWYN